MVSSRSSARSFRLAAALALAACQDEGAGSGTTAGSTTSGVATSTQDGGEGTTGATTSGATTSGGTTSPPTTDPTNDGTAGETTDATTGEPSPPDPREQALVTYAPRVWFPADEEYFPSTVEFVYPHTTRFADGDGNHWIRTIEPLESPSDELPFFAGDLATAPVYAFYAEKGGGVVDLVYFFFYPYNRGKEVVDTIWGNHVGDWEHITVRLMRGPGDVLTPLQVYLSAHSFGGAYDWADVERTGDTHPVVYSAWGSHGLWKDPGDHVYMTIGEEVLDVCVTVVCADLTDETSAGIAWDTWENVAGFDFFEKEGLGGASWPVWMSDAFTDPGAPPPTTPGGGPIFRWGNPEDCSTLGVDISDLIGVCRLEDGPTGPVSKDTWGQELL